MGKDPEANDGFFGTEAAHKALWVALLELEREASSGDGVDVSLVGVSIRGPQWAGDDSLVVVRGKASDGSKMVAFHAASPAPKALLQALRKHAEGDLRWKKDKFHEE
jgi:hypothetical protein